MLNRIDLSRSDLNLLVLFETVLEERHVGRSAARLSLSPSAVSHGLGRLRRLFNDPLFLRTPRGVVPTERAIALAEPVAEIMAGIRKVIASAEPFDPATSTRRFTIGAPDGVSAVFLSRLLADLRQSGPGIDISVRQLLPVPGEASPQRAWRTAFEELDARAMDAAVIPSDDVPARFHRQLLYEEDFVVAAAQGSAFAKAPTIDLYCDMHHLVVSLGGDPHGFVDDVLAREGRSRRIVSTVPNFMFALAVIAENDLLAALPRRFAALHAPRFGVACVEAPIPLGRFPLTAVASSAAIKDEGVSWLLDAVQKAAEPSPVR